jgi:uncharacterized protein YkwD
MWGQCGSVYEYGKKYPIPCNWNYMKYSQDSLRKQEKIFIDLLNVERKKKGFQPLVYDDKLYHEVAIPQAKKMARDVGVSHTTANVFECVVGVFYGYRRTHLAEEAMSRFMLSKPHWNILNIPKLKRIAVAMEICPSESDEKDGVVYVSVVLNY